MTANQRLKGLLSGKSSGFDKPIPIPTVTDLPPPVPPAADKPRSSALCTTANNAHDHMDRDPSANESQVSLGLSPSPPIQKPKEDQAGTGFKQVELPSSNAQLETPHPKDQ